MAVLQWEERWEDRQMVFRKKRGKITFDDLTDTMQSREFLNAHEGKLFAWSFRPYAERYDDYGDEMGDGGDVAVLSFAEDEDPCPICSSRRYWQYCPQCGAKLTEVIT